MKTKVRFTFWPINANAPVRNWEVEYRWKWLARIIAWKAHCAIARSGIITARIVEKTKMRFTSP